MQVLLVAINAKYIHSNPAIYSLKQAAQPHTCAQIQTLELTINQHHEDMLREIYLLSPDCIGFSCYLWNYEIVRHLVTELQSLLPQTTLILGGPEVSYTPAQTLKEIPADIVMIGEGEKTIIHLLNCLTTHGNLSQIAGIVYRKNSQILQTGPAELPNMEQLPFIYPIIYI